jgi:hypothetical protein
MLETYLADLENRIDPDVEEALLAEWRRFVDGDIESGFFSPRRSRQAPPGVEWPRVTVNEALEDFDRMALQQLGECSAALADGSGAVLNVRANYGTGILSTVFGAEVFLMDAELDTLPTTKPLAGGEDDIRRLVEAGVPDLRAGHGANCLAMGERFRELLDGYPKVSKYVRIYHPDLQGPINLCELLWGSGMFMALMDQAELVESLLNLITETYIRYLDTWNEIVPPGDGYSSHWGMMHRGYIMLRDDSAMNLSPAMFSQFVEPYDQRLLDRFGGGAIHFCGRGDHYIDRVARMKGVHAVNMTQPEYNDIEKVYQNTVDRGIKLLGLERSAAEAAVEAGRELHGNAHCW